MVHLSLFSVVLFAGSIVRVAQAAPIELQRRIDQTISAATQPWQQACESAGGSQSTCSGVAVPAFTSLLAEGGICDQQNAADSMIDLAKQLGNDPEMIRLAQIFVQQPRNAPDSLQVPYCQVAPKNAELNGLFHCQFSGSDFTKFSGDQTGNVPLGLTSLNPAGSCPASPDAPVPDGVQLNTLVQSPVANPGDSTGAPTANSTIVDSSTEVTSPASCAIPTAASGPGGSDTFNLPG
ncbi:hypothetical protein CVT26_011350 [Gymnopilus dilepis]|uniref:Uncharacterized protein n=1 Tax=Gymnopilus dilepis TaxID=231916 RepID=A0A409X0T2_9AGAR|nr:hypothetical protein CVT26_011350 [Gymnopilus dilepis]